MPFKRLMPNMASLTPKPDGTEDESFIILGTSPGTSLDLKCNGMDAPSLDRGALDDAMKDLPEEASSAFKAHFKLNEGPSMASLMVASSLITDEKSTEELQKQFGELLDENIILKETLKKNNESMKEQFLMIASCQEDMMKTHMIHKEKFDETRELVEKLRQENKKLKSDIARLAESEPHKSNETTSSGPPSALEFVTSPDDDTINKLTAQLELVEKQRRQVIVENEKLTWQKESLETIVDATSKERDDLKEKLKKIELEFSKYKSGVLDTVKMYKDQIIDLQNRLKEAQTTVFQPVRFSISSEPENSSSEYGNFIANVKLYDKTLKHLAELLNLVTHGSVDSLVQCLGVVSSLHDFKMERSNVDQVRSSLADLKQTLEKQHNTALSNM
ncbi:NF-kappa-B essential modulator isoform X2 [Phthorimaea operculella]|nr:NF-kappa-B essential modulator isoform X2 [Phthorimaea operculella]